MTVPSPSQTVLVDVLRHDLRGSLTMTEPQSFARALDMPVASLPTPVAVPGPHVATDGVRGDTEVAVSSTFTLSADLDPRPPDLVLISSDFCLFYVHRLRLGKASDNAFGGLLRFTGENTGNFMSVPHLGDLQLLPLAETKDLVNIMLHAAYGRPISQFRHPIHTVLTAASQTLPMYGMPVNVFVAPGTPLYSAISDVAPIAPILVYAFAAEHNLEDLAVAASTHTHGCDVDSIDAATAQRMGGTYVNRLHCLHATRLRSLKMLLSKQPYPHLQTPGCSPGQRLVAIKAWSLAAAQIFFDATPGTSIATTPGAIQSVLSGLIASLPCEDCKTMLDTSMREVIDGWLLTQRSI